MSLIIFRLDSSLTLGSGHAQRCAALAGNVKNLGHESIFICKNLEGNFCYLLEREGYKIFYLAAELDETQDAEETIKLIKLHPNAKSIVIDNYQLSKVYELKLKELELKIVVIDDLMNRYHCCDVILDQNYKNDYVQSYNDLVPSNCKKFLGPSYALLRPEFYNRNGNKNKITEIKNIFVFFGGSDPTGETFRFLSTLKPDTSFRYHVMISKGNIFLEKILSMKLLDCFILYVDPKDVASLMGHCEFYIGSGGTITWERMSLGISGIVVAVADNQIPVAKALHQSKLHWYLGECQSVDYSIIPGLIKGIVKNSLAHINWQREQFKIILGQDNIQNFINAILE